MKMQKFQQSRPKVKNTSITNQKNSFHHNNSLKYNYIQTTSLKPEINSKKTKKQKLSLDFRWSILKNQASSTDRAIELALGFPVKRKETEPPLALHVHGLNHPSAVWTRPRRHLPRQDSLVLVAHEHQTHRVIPPQISSSIAVWYVCISERLFGAFDRKSSNWLFDLIDCLFAAKLELQFLWSQGIGDFPIYRRERFWKNIGGTGDFSFCWLGWRKVMC